MNLCCISFLSMSGKTGVEIRGKLFSELHSSPLDLFR